LLLSGTLGKAGVARRRAAGEIAWRLSSANLDAIRVVDWLPGVNLS
jgi:hypothetical protein